MKMIEIYTGDELTARASWSEDKEMCMSHNDTLHLTQEFLGRMGSGAAAAEIAKLFSENMEWEVAGDTGVLPWIGQKSGRAAITDFVNDSRAMIERISFEVHDILAGDNRAVILGSLASKFKRTSKIVKTDFAIVLTVANGQIVRFQMLEDSFAVSQAARA
jgi:ketosteroid isomerase-like protein